MGRIHKVQEGECISSIALQYGLLRETIEAHPDNADLKKERQDLTILVAGKDQLKIPDIRTKTITVQTGKLYPLRRKGVPEIFRRRFLDRDDEPRSSIKYLAEIDGIISTGETDSGGLVELPISPKAEKVILTLKGDGREERYEFALGYLPPVDTPEGLRFRLAQMGFLSGNLSEVTEETTQFALEQFQNYRGLTMTGNPDSETLDALISWFEAKA